MDAGLDGSNAGTSLRASLLALNNPAKAQQRMMDKLGFSMRDSEGNAKNLTEMIRDMQAATEGMTEADKVATLGKLVGTEAVSGFLALMKAGPDAITANTVALENSAGASQAAADMMMAGIGGALEEMSGAFESAAILIGDQLTPYIQKFAEKVSELVDKFNALSPEAHKFIAVGAALFAGITGLVAVFGAVLAFIGMVASGIGALTGLFAPLIAKFGTALTLTGSWGGALMAVIGPIGIAIAAIIAIGAALVIAYNKVEWFRDFVDSAWAKIKELTSVAFKAVKDTVTNIVKDVVSFASQQLDKFKVFWDENGKAIMSIVKVSFDSVMTNIKFVMGLVKSIFEVVWPQITAVIDMAWRLIKSIVSTAINIVLGTIQTILKVLQGDWKAAWETIKSTVANIWNDVKAQFKPSEMIQIGKDMISGLIKGIGSMVDAVKTRISDLASSMPEWMKKILGIHSPSRVMIEIGKWTGRGLASGIDGTKSVVQSSIKELGGTIVDIAQHFLDEEKKIWATSKSEISKIAKRSAEDIAKIERSAAQKKRGLTADDALKIQRIKEDSVKKIADIEQKATKQSVELISKNQKEMLDGIKLFISDRQSMEEMSLVQEAAIWEKSVKLFENGTKERVVAQQEYQKALKSINDEVTKTNTEYADKMTVINDKLRKDEQELTDKYTKTVDDRASALLNFAGTFDAFEFKLEQTGSELLSNLKSQVMAFKGWQQQIELLSSKAIDEGLLEELRAMGPKALPELIALNSMTDKQMSDYSALYKEKSKLARTQAETELVGMKTDTAKRITELRATANTELETLRKDWTTKIKSITKATDTELMSLKSIGQNAGQGLLNGLASMESSLVSKARSIAESVKSAMAGAFDIHSPSRWMRDFIGVNMMTGWIDGIASMRNSVLSMSANASGWMTPEVPKIAGYQTPVSGAGAGRSAVSASAHGGNGTSGGITQNITIHTPTALSPSEVARKSKQASQELALEWGMR